MTNASYTVLARRYRPSRLKDLIGQDVLQTTLTEAILQNRLPHAILLHGIRGVGKTTTARIIARALNCQGEDGKGGATPNPCGVCASCLDIQNDRHLDVVEMDAASRTGVDDIREVIESARYKAVKGRFKIFIIDEVHMLSKSAFNALLKTLEEPPAHVKFIFATTELRKIPDTILSRCMRFDLKRIEPATILEHLTSLCSLESITADADALGMIARAGDGSMRDALSLLDQAIALSLSNNSAGVTVELVQRMLGTSNRDHLFNLVHSLFKGETAEVLKQTDALFLMGSDPLLLMQEVLENVYWLTCLKTQPHMKDDPTWPPAERARGVEILDGLGISSLARAWQILSKGYEEVQKNPLPKQAVQMVFVRFCHMSTLPPLEKIIESFTTDGGNQDAPTGTQNSSNGATNRTNMLSTQAAMPAVIDELPLHTPASFAEVVALLQANNEILLAAQLEQEARIVHFEPFHIIMNMDTKRVGHLPTQLRKMLQRLTGRDWTLTISTESHGKTLLAEQQEKALQMLESAKAHPFMKELLSAFPNATVTMEK